MVSITKNITTVNRTKGVNTKKYIVIHYTGNKTDGALANANYFKSVNRGASAHYFVDENSAYQSVEDKNIAWHCGAKKYKHSTCRNSNSLGVELCSRKDSKGNFYFMDKTVDNAVELIKMLMAKYNVPIANVIRHYDVTGKNCPEPFVKNIEAWQNFKNRLEENVVKQNIKINGKVKSVDAINKDGYTYIKIRDLSDILSIMYDNNTKLISIGIK